MLEEIQGGIFARAAEIRDQRTRTDITTWEELEKHFGKDKEGGFDANPGFVRAAWGGDEAAAEAKLKPLGVSIRCLPLEQNVEGLCVITGRPAKFEAVFARSY